MSIEVIVVTCLVITGVAFLFSMVGQGGGSSYVPVLLAAGMSMREASTTGLFMIMLASISATLVFGHKRTIDWKLLFAIAIPSLFSSFLGGYVAQWVSVPILKIIFTVMLITAAIFMLRPAREEGQSPGFLPKWGLWDRRCGDYQYRVSLLVIPTVALVGFVAGMIGVGGGLFVLPLLVLLFGCPIRIAIGITSTFNGLSAMPGFIGHLLGGDPFHIWLALPLAAAAFGGARLGPILSLRTGLPKLRVILATILIALSVWMIAKIFI